MQSPFSNTVLKRADPITFVADVLSRFFYSYAAAGAIGQVWWYFRLEKADSTLRPQAESSVDLRMPAYRESQCLTKSGIPKPPLQGRWQHTCLRTIVLPPFHRSKRDRSCTNLWSADRGRTQSVKDYGDDVRDAHLRSTPFKDNRFQSQLHTCAFTFASGRAPRR